MRRRFAPANLVLVAALAACPADEPTQVSAAPGTCTANGSPAPEPASWAETQKLCEAERTGGGCEEGFTCAPRPEAGVRACGESAQCAFSAETWYTDFEDTRTCGTCSCVGSGGDCGNVRVRLGSDWGCNVETSLLMPGQKDCSATPYSPPVILIGTPTSITCAHRPVL